MPTGTGVAAGGASGLVGGKVGVASWANTGAVKATNVKRAMARIICLG